MVDGYRVYVTHSEENYDTTAMGRVVCIDGRGTGDITKTAELWRSDGIDAGYASPLLHGGRLYVMCNSGVLHCFDAVSGKQYWEFLAGRIGKGSPVWADGKIYLTTANGTFVILEDTATRAAGIDSIDFNAGGEEGIEIFGSPAISDGRIVFFTTTEMVCFGKKDATAQQAVAAPAAPARRARREGARRAVGPAGGSAAWARRKRSQFQALAYDRHGRLIGPAEPQWPIRRSSARPTPRAGSRRASRAGIGEVRPQLGKLAGTARVRVVPDLPIGEDFESFKDGEIIGWWMGVSKAKYVIETAATVPRS